MPVPVEIQVPGILFGLSLHAAGSIPIQGIEKPVEVGLPKMNSAKTTKAITEPPLSSQPHEQTGRPLPS